MNHSLGAAFAAFLVSRESSRAARELSVHRAPPRSVDASGTPAARNDYRDANQRDAGAGDIPQGGRDSVYQP
jgi:hypothetical protein